MPLATATAPPPPVAPDLESIRRPVRDDLAAVDRVIELRLRSEVGLINEISQYIVHSGGKRLRPLLALLSARSLGYAGSQHCEMATVIEFIHTSTLLHDDVVDASSMRRGNATANAVWGNEASVLVGDFLYSRAFQMMVAIRNMRIMEVMADTTNLIAEGEVLQLLNCHDPETTEARYRQVIESKTARLFEAAARIGAVLAEADLAREEALASYGLHLGTAYQLVDDVLDYEGTIETIGKNVGSDLAEGKPTLPLIYAIRVGDESQSAAIRAAIRTGGREHIPTVLAAVESTGAITYTSRAAQIELERALAALESIPDSPYRETLQQLAEFCVSRSF